jgi:hypothetical protein
MVVVIPVAHGKHIATEECPETSLAAKGLTLGGENNREPRQRTQSDSQRLDEEANCLQNLIAHFDVAQFGRTGELQFFPKPVQNSGIQVRPLVKQVKQFRGSGGVLIVGFDTARIFYGDR